MTGKEHNILAFIGDSDSCRFIIPVYQRNYDWEQEQCERLYDDLVDLVRSKRKSHFFGCIVSLRDKNDNLQIIDGQQRLTTVSLLLLAIRDMLKRGHLSSEKHPDLADTLYGKYLTHKNQDSSLRIQFRPSTDDFKEYAAVFQHDANTKETSHFKHNYDYFRERISRQEITADELFEALGHLEIIKITLDKACDEPQLVFETLNTTGLTLSEGDKVRNLILMNLDAETQDKFYNDYWCPLEINTDGKISAFIRDYLSVKQQRIPSVGKVYSIFKKLYTAEEDRTTLLNNMKMYAGYYSLLIRANSGDKVLDACIARLNQLEITVYRPFLLEVLRLQHEKAIEPKDVLGIFLVVEIFLFRRLICDVPTNALSKLFATLHHTIMRLDGSAKDYAEKFKHVLLGKTESQRFPNDEDFIKAFSEREVYLMSTRSKVYMLERLNNFNTLEAMDIVKPYADKTYSIEHIMPQTLTREWKQDLGENWQDIHTTWLHRIANLTLTAYNSTYGNLPFSEKRDLPHGYNDSNFALNKWIAKQERWTEVELEERNKQLKEKARQIWKIPTSTYVPPAKPVDTYSLQDDIDFTGHKPSGFTYRGDFQPAGSWQEVITAVVQSLCRENKALLVHFATSKGSEGSPNIKFSTTGEGFNNPKQITEDIFLECNSSTSEKIALLRKLFHVYGIEEDELSFTLRSDKDLSKYSDTERKHFEFWDIALKTLCPGCSAFAKIHPTKDHWLNSSIGISDFSISNVATLKNVSVQLILSKKDKDLNTAAFDCLYQQKNDIENAFGLTPEWLRREDQRNSYVIVTRDDMSFNNRDDWPKIADFFLEWNLRFREVLVPLLKDWVSKQ